MLAPVWFAVLIEFVDAERGVHLGHETALHSAPIGPKAGDERRVDRDTAPLLLRHRPHELCAQHCVRQRSNCRNDMRNEERKSANVVFAITQNVGGLFGGERRTLHDPIAHVSLVRGINSALAKVLQRAGKTVETFRALCAFNSTVVHVVTEFDVGIERTGRLTPAERDVATVFRAQHVADEQCVSIEPIGWEAAELVTPLANDPATSHFERNEAERG
jgi:hypothetical protein